MTEDELLATYPRLWQMAHDGAWPALRDHGLKSASALLDDYGVFGAERAALLGVRRPQSVAIASPGLPGAVLRDQKPMDDGRLGACLQDGLTPADWYSMLNTMSFFWLSRSRIWTLLGAQAYRNVAQTVLTIDAASLVAAHRDRIRLSPINSGATLFKPQPRGLGTFKTVAEFPFTARAATRRSENNVVELVVDHSVPDLADHVLAVHRARNDEILEEVWRRPGVSNAERP